MRTPSRGSKSAKTSSGMPSCSRQRASIQTACASSSVSSLISRTRQKSCIASLRTAFVLSGDSASIQWFTNKEPIWNKRGAQEQYFPAISRQSFITSSKGFSPKSRVSLRYSLRISSLSIWGSYPISSSMLILKKAASRGRRVMSG